MEIEKLIDALKKARADGSWNTLSDLSHKAANALEQLQAELERVRVERDAYEIYFMAVSSKPDCNTCEKRACE